MPDRPTPAAALPVTDTEFGRLAATAFEGMRSIVLAVSGGSDSMALMLLAARWQATVAVATPHIVVATVDHGLRPASAEEASWVAARTAELGLPHETLRWEGPKPPTHIQASARNARYALLSSVAARTEPRPCAIAVAHHQDDQAETLLMRLARGSGIDGLSAMQPARVLVTAPEVKLVRPLLSLPKARLVATLEALGQRWIEDPSNEIAGFERVRLRNARRSLDEAGLTSNSLASSTRRLARARAALDHGTHDLQTRAVSLNGGAYAAIDWQIFAQAPEELRLRLLQRILACFGGASPPARLSQLEALTARLETPPTSFAATLGGCLVRVEAGELRIYREPGRRGLPHLRLNPGAHAIWDQRFKIELDALCPQPIDIRAITPSVLAERKRDRTAPRSRLPRRAQLTLPAAWDGDRFLAPLHPALGSPRPDDDTGIVHLVAASFLAAMDEQYESRD